MPNNRYHGYSPFLVERGENFANLRREEHNRTSMLYRRPSDQLNISSHLYIDEKPTQLQSVNNTTGFQE